MDRPIAETALTCSEEEICYEVVREAPPDEMVALYEAAGWWHELPEWRRQLPDLVRGSLVFVVARRHGGPLLGMGRVISDGVSDAYLQDIVVLPEARGNGVGRNIVCRLLRECKDRGLSWIGLIAENGTQGFYERLGFSRVAGDVPMLLDTAAIEPAGETYLFLGRRFRHLTLADRKRLEPFLRRHPHPLAGYTFAALASWQNVFDYGWCFVEPDGLLLSARVDGDGRRDLLQPLGDVAPHIWQSLTTNAAALTYPLRVWGVSDTYLEAHPELALQFDRASDRAGANYVYRVQELAELDGHRYAKKRNLLSQAQSLNPWTAHVLRAGDAQGVAACLELLERLHEEEPERLDLPASIATSKAQERRVLEYSLQHVDELGLSGLLLRVGGEPAAFSLWEMQTPDTAVIHFERARRRFKGLYQAINWEAARILAGQGVTWVNWEEDVDDPGLRQAKLSYFPDHLTTFWTLARHRQT